ncbi:MAG TPA: isoprenylcysteine carboxylmethyltransferase family protein [Ktedonobacterales bacterium]
MRDAPLSTPPASTAATARLDSPGVRVPPPVHFALALVAGWLLQRWLPLPALPPALAFWPGVALVAGAVLWNAWAVPTMLRGRGTLNTAGASAALVTSGPYRCSRNPMYLGLALLAGGLALTFGITWALALLVPVLIYTQVRVIVPEERYLERTFGESYRAYRARVRRWI